MNQAKLKTYPMQTTPAIPGAVRLPNTLHEHFRADPLGCASFGEYVKKTKDSATVAKT